jgi:REP element-mobilizing transposase RayT
VTVDAFLIPPRLLAIENDSMRSEENNDGHRPPLQWKRRLARLDRIYVRHPIYFVTANTAKRRPILTDHHVHDTFISFALDGPKYGAWIGRYVLMPDHCHLFLAYDDERITLSNWAKSFKNTLSRVWRERQVAAPHWQKGIFDHLLRSDQSATEKWNYVRQNPVRAGLVEHAEDWQFAGEIFPLEYRSERL